MPDENRSQNIVIPHMDRFLENIGILPCKVSFGPDGNIPIFGSHTKTVVEAYTRWDAAYRQKWKVKEMDDPAYLRAEVEKQVKEGALAAAITSRLPWIRQVYDIGCGTGIVALTCALIGEKPVIGIDPDDEVPVIETVKSLGRKLQAERAEFKVMALDTALETEITKDDLVCAISAPDHVEETMLEQVGQGVDYMIFSYHDSEKNRCAILEPLAEKGFSVAPIPLLKYGEKYENVPSYFPTYATCIVERPLCPGRLEKLLPEHLRQLRQTLKDAGIDFDRMDFE